MFNIAVLVSGGGTNLQAIIDDITSGYLKNVNIKWVISDVKDAYALERARKHNINTLILDKKVYRENLSKAIYDRLKDEVDLIVLAGFLSIITSPLVEEFKNKIINIHPSLIPSFCGKGMYGLKVHEAAIKYGVKISGCTVHFVDENTDTGAIILQKSVPVLEDDTAKILQSRILKEEHKALCEAIMLLESKKININGRMISIEE